MCNQSTLSNTHYLPSGYLSHDRNTHGLFGGKRWEASSLKTLACCWYFSGTSIFAIYCSTCHARSIDIELMVVSSVRISIILCFASVVTVLPIRVLAFSGSI